MKRIISLIIAMMLVFGLTVSAHAVSFTPLGDLSGGGFYSYASGVSADGSVVVGGGVSASGGEAFRWTSGGGMAALGGLSGGGFFSTPLAYLQMALSWWVTVVPPPEGRHSAGRVGVVWQVFGTFFFL